MGYKELESLLALSKAAPMVFDVNCASTLLDQLSPYLLEVLSQTFSPSPALGSFRPSPWEILSSSLSSAVLSLGSKHSSLRASALETISHFLERVRQAVAANSHGVDGDELGSPVSEHEASARIATVAVALLGFLDAAVHYADIWTVLEKQRVVESLRELLSDSFLTSIETALSTTRHLDSSDPRVADWKRYIRQYAAMGNPLGAMLVQRRFMRLVACMAAGLVLSSPPISETEMMDRLALEAESAVLFRTTSDGTDPFEMEPLVDLAVGQMRLLEDGADFLQLGSAWQQRLAFAAKASTLTILSICTLLDRELSDTEALLSWLEDTVNDPVQMSDERLASVVLHCMAILAKVAPEEAAPLCRSLLRYVVRSAAQGNTMAVAVKALSRILQGLSEDGTISTLYTLGNALSTSNDEKPTPTGITPNGSIRANGHVPDGTERAGSAISLVFGAEDTTIVYGNVIQAIVGIATARKDEKITALAQSMLIQKIGKINAAVDGRIISETAGLALIGTVLELRSLLRLYSKVCHDGLVQKNEMICGSVSTARVFLAANLPTDSPLYALFLVHLLESVVSRGDIQSKRDGHNHDFELAVREVGQLLPPLALVVSRSDLARTTLVADDILSLARDAWFNIVVHGSTASDPKAPYAAELRTLAVHLRPLVADDGSISLEADIELNTVLRRGMTVQRTGEHKRALAALLPSCESQIKGLSYPQLLFLRATYLMETTRAETGACTQIFSYFVDQDIGAGSLGRCMDAICEAVTDLYIRKAIQGIDHRFSASNLAKQLAAIFVCCCHRVEDVQHVASAAADRIIKATPSALCQKASLFALLELLSLMWTSCLDEERDEYRWTPSLTSSKVGLTIDLSDDYALRKRTLNSLYKRARVWVMRVINVAPMDVKGLLQTYLSEYIDDGTFGHLSLGRSFALDMGCTIPSTDQRLTAIDRHGDFNINTASDFMGAYTKRQEYMRAGGLFEKNGDEGTRDYPSGEASHPCAERKAGDLSAGIEASLANLEAEAQANKEVSNEELRRALGQAASFLSRPREGSCSIARQLVRIPFILFTKQSINLGISLWLNVINENPAIESRLLVEIAEHCQDTVRRRLGMFDSRLSHIDPFYHKKEFAPSDSERIHQRQQAALRLISPHLKLVQFLSSQFNACRLGNVHTQTVFQRLAYVMLSELRHPTGHPLTREAHFQMVLFGLSVLRYSTGMDARARWKLKDRVLSAALSWFTFPPRWSYGGNRLQVKAETHILANVESALQNVTLIGLKPWGSFKSLQAKQDLLLALIQNEQNRLIVWLFPLDHDARQHFAANSNSKSAPSDTLLLNHLGVAWQESVALAVQFVSRFKHQPLNGALRTLLLEHPEQGIGQAEAVSMMLGTSLLDDVSWQLKYLLYWAPVDPITAVNYFLPAYRSHPFILQYAMRALEAHSVDVTFFYVPQIVQTLRYDALGYVERYIVQTAKFSQLFAHQIIWNMKANSYKDEDSQIPDPIKPELDKVMKNMLSSFSPADHSFYEREFAFFAEVTGISGKLRPYIKRSKAEKKQKIEEELRRIKVDVGVYLPSNPDGIVIGIDRTSGKPLQSHAKAPYMATFWIRKTAGETSEAKGAPEQAHQNAGTTKQIDTMEVWQSAIFKVGDDCRQDVLALQMIAAFRGIFHHVGLDAYVFPYRVTATAPGCGVIDVLPNSISRDMLGRETVNGLYDYFVSKYGGEQSIRFQEARSNFVKSMAAYSVISYLLQFKDRHNGNIMVDDAGHILHIDFGFCFDIAPGGVKFERAPFKLTSEMVAVMGGVASGQSHSESSQPYRWFEELCIKAFLASRPHTEQLVDIVRPMLGSGLPCFKPETMDHFRDRFVLDKSETEAADFMRDLIKKSRGSYSTKGYDQFQLMTNGIPY